MDPTKDALPGNWHDLKGQVRQKWGKLTADDLSRMNGTTGELAGALQQRYGYSRPQAEIEINIWLHGLDAQAKT
jgi:uncharacterized protein YjbJ (UPF0337 family)